ncbi:MAG: ABC transporter substrate-binding protein, partial [Haliea sp.]
MTKTVLRLGGMAFCSLMAAFVATPGIAQKAKDTVRLGLTEPTPVVSAYYNLGRENSFFYRTVFDTLIVYKEETTEFVPLLAKSWKRVDPRTFEFELRDDVKFHNGNSFDADDVIHTINFALDRNSKIQLPRLYTWIEKVEKLGPHKIRIISSSPSAIDLINLANTFIYDQEYHQTFEDKIDHGRSPVGTGAFRILEVDSNKGILAEKYDGFSHGPDWMKGHVERVHALPIHDRDTQIANLMTGNLDAVKDATEDQLSALKKDPNLTVTGRPSTNMTYLMFDAAAR